MILIVNHLFAVLTVVAQIIFVSGWLYFLIYRHQAGNRLLKFLAEQGIAIAFFVALAATLGSLFYSQVAGFAPCDLCWYQRIFMYPQVFILGLAWIKQERRIIDYSLVLALFGLLISLYHNYVSWGGVSVNVSTTAFFVGVSCLRRYVFEFGYITIPLMGLTAFALLILVLMAQKTLNQKRNNN